MLVGTPRDRPRTIEDLIGPELMGRLDRLDVLSRKVFAGKLPGERRSKKRGRSVEFDDYRNYVPGDDLRHIDWNVFARLDRFFIKLFREEEDLSLHIVFDASVSMDAGRANKLLFAQRLAMAVGYIGLVNHNRVSMTAFGIPGRSELVRLAPLRGRPSIRRLSKFMLESIWPVGDTPPGPRAPASSFVSAMRELASLRHAKGVTLVLSDFLFADGYEQGVGFLAGAARHGWDAYCLHVLSPEELDPSGDDVILGDLRLVDAETGDHAEVTISPALLKRYRQRVDRYCESINRYCAARDVSYALLRSDTDIATLVLDYLRKRGVVG